MSLLQLDFMPFDPMVKRTEGTIETAQGEKFKTTKGAPNILLKLCEGPGAAEVPWLLASIFLFRVHRA